MSRRTKGPRIEFKKTRYSKKGKLVERGKYVIRDGKTFLSTGCFEGEIEEAETRLAEYILDKLRKPNSGRSLGDIRVAEVLSYYHEVKRSVVSNQRNLDRYVEVLNEYFGDKFLSELTPGEFRKFARDRNNIGVRDKLEYLKAAINLHEKDGYHTGTIRIPLPPKGDPRTRWLTRSEAAALIWICWRYREKQAARKRDPKSNKRPTRRYPLRHLARFILIEPNSKRVERFQ